MRYADHIDLASRYAALAITAPLPDPAYLALIRVLHDDLAAILAEATGRALTAMPVGQSAPAPTPAERRTEAAARGMLTQLESYPRLATPVGQAAPPSVRWSGRPVHPAEAVDDPASAWKGLVAEAFLARSSLDNAAHLPGPERRVVLRDLAVLSEAFASATRDLAHGADLPLGDAGRTQVMELASAARRVQRHAGAHPGTSGPDLAASKERRTVRTVGTVAALPTAVQNLTRLAATGPTSTATLFSTTIVVTRLAQATSEALRAAARSPRTADPERLRGAAESLTQFASELGRVVTTHQRELASLPRGCPATLAQARELGASGQPRIRDLAPRPDSAAGAAPELLAVASELGRTTLAIQARFANLADGEHLLARDRSEDIQYGWRQANPRDVEPLLGGFGQAAKALGSLPVAPIAPPHNREVIAKPASGQVVDLRAALARRRADLGSLPAAAGPAPARTPAHSALAR